MASCARASAPAVVTENRSITVPLSIQEEAQLWRERYRVLFGENVAGIMLTTPEGRIVDCNEACARIFGFDSKEAMLAQSDAWDFYFNRAEREILIDRLRTPGNSSAEEVCLRARDGAPIWVIARSTVASYVDGVPELLQGTFIDTTAQKLRVKMLMAEPEILREAL